MAKDLLRDEWKEKDAKEAGIRRALLLKGTIRQGPCCNRPALKEETDNNKIQRLCLQQPFLWLTLQALKLTSTHWPTLLLHRSDS
jgi:hypothetical protein